MQKIQYNMNTFNGTLLLVKGGSKTFDNVRGDIEAVRNEFRTIYNTINSINPPRGLEEVHSIVEKASKLYYDSMGEFIKFYADGNDDHFVNSGMMINEANELMYQGADLLNRF
ncbi:MAG: hypothetical protein ABFC12_04260 [Methanobacterium sp.]